MKVLTAWREALSRPGLIGLVFVVRSSLAIAAAALWLGAFSPGWIMGLPQRDESLFEPGLATLLRLLSENGTEWSHLARVTLGGAAGALVVGAVLVTFVLHALAHRSKSWRALRATFASLPLQVLITACYAVCVLLAVFVTQRLSHVLPALVYPLLGEKGADAMLLTLALVLVATLVGIRITCDLARIAAIQSNRGALLAVATALGSLRDRWRFWVGAYSCLTLPTLLLPILIEWWLPTFGKSPRFGFWPALVHQLTIVALSAFQLSWWVLVRNNASVPQRQNHSQLHVFSGEQLTKRSLRL